jgi:hypothetical protein
MILYAILAYAFMVPPFFLVRKPTAWEWLCVIAAPVFVWYFVFRMAKEVRDAN